MYNLKIKLKYDGKSKLILNCAMIWLIEVGIFSIILNITKPHMQSLNLMMTAIFSLASVIALYKLWSFKILNNILDRYNLIANKLVARHLKKSHESIARLSLDVIEVDNYANFYKRLFSPDELKLISTPKSSAHMCLDKLIKDTNTEVTTNTN